MTSLDAIIRDCAHLARNAMMAEIHAHWDEIVELAVERSGPGSVGEREHGNTIFSKPPSMLRRDRFEEYADALVYFQVEHR